MNIGGMAVPEGLGIDQAYLERGAKAAKKALGNRYHQSKHPVTPEQIAGFVQKSYETGAMRYTGLYMRMLEASCWRYAQHGLRVNTTNWTFETIPIEARIPPPTLALIGDKVDTIKGEYLKSLPEGVYLSKDQTPFNRRGAELVQARMAQKDEEDKILEKMDLAVDCCITWGDIYAEVVHSHTHAKKVELPLYVEWDPGDGNIIRLPQEDAQGNPITKTVRLADEDTNLIYAPQIMMNQSATGLEDSTIIHTHVFRDLDWAMSQWREQAEKMVGASMETEAGHFQNRLRNLMMLDTWSGAAVGTFSGMSNYNEEAVLIHVIRMNPDDFYPSGRYFIVAGGQTVVAGPLPFDKLTLVHLAYNPIPNSPVSNGMVRSTIQLNRHLEQMAHQAMMQRRTLGVPFVLAHQRTGGDFASGTLAMGYGKVFTWTGQHEPKVVVPGGTMDAGFVREMEFYLGEFFQRGSGVRQGMEGERPAGVYPASLLRMIIAQNISKFIPHIGRYRKFIEQLFSLRAELTVKSPAAQFPRKVEIAIGATSKMWLEVTAQDLGDNVTYKVESIPGANTDPATRMQDIDAFLQNGVLDPGDPRTRNAILREAGLGSLIPQMDPNVAKADDENARIAAGEDVQIGPYENDRTHLEIHTEWINHPKFWLMDEDRQVATIMHAKDHEDRLTLRAQEAALSGAPQLDIPSMNGSGAASAMGGAAGAGAGPLPPALTPGNGVKGLPQTSMAQQMPRRPGRNRPM